MTQPNKDEVQWVMDRCFANERQCQETTRGVKELYTTDNVTFLKTKKNRAFSSDDVKRYNQLRESFLAKKQDGDRREVTDQAYFHLREVCPVSGECVPFGHEEENFAALFNNFDLRDTSKVVAVKAIGEVSANGFIREIELRHTLQPGFTYSSYVILKSNAGHRRDGYAPDSLYYEYCAGIYVNSLLKRYPAFCKTYGAYMYPKTYGSTRPDYRTYMRQLDNMKFVKTALETLEDATLQDSVLNYENVCLAVQHIHKAIPLKALIQQYRMAGNPDQILDTAEQDVLKYEIKCALYQVYYVLMNLPGFTHNDLHASNVLLTPAPTGKCFQYTYKNGITFKCSYAAKIIDYGRACFPGSEKVRDDLSTAYGVPVAEFENYGYRFTDSYGDLFHPCDRMDLRLYHIALLYMQEPQTFFSHHTEGSPVSESCFKNFKTQYLRDQVAKYKQPPECVGQYCRTVRDVCPVLAPAIQKFKKDWPEVICSIRVDPQKDMVVQWALPKRYVPPPHNYFYDQVQKTLAYFKQASLVPAEPRVHAEKLELYIQQLEKAVAKLTQDRQGAIQHEQEKKQRNEIAELIHGAHKAPPVTNAVQNRQLAATQKHLNRVAAGRGGTRRRRR